MAPCIRTHFMPAPDELLPLFPLLVPLTRFDLQGQKGDIKKEEKRTRYLENEDDIRKEMPGNPTPADRRKEQLHHYTDLNRNKHFMVENNGHETTRHPENENHAHLNGLYTSSSLDYFARLRNPKAVPFRHPKTIPKRIHSRQLLASSELGSLAQSISAANLEPKGHSLLITGQVLDPHTHNTNHLRSLFSRLCQASHSILIQPKHIAKVSKPHHSTNFRYTHLGMSHCGNHTTFRNTKGQIVWAQGNQLLDCIVQCSEPKESSHVTSRANIVHSQRQLGEMEAPTGRMPRYDVHRFAEGINSPTVDFFCSAGAVLSFLVLGIWLACMWKAIKTGLALREKNRRKVRMGHAFKALRSHLRDTKFVDGFEKQKS